MAVIIGADSTAGNQNIGVGTSPQILWRKNGGQAASSDATLSSLSVHIHTARGFNYAIGIYSSDGLTLLGYTGSFAGADTTSYTEDLVSPVNVTSGTSYILALFCSGGYIQTYDDGSASSSIAINYGTETFPNFPASLSETYGYSNMPVPAIWANGTAGGAAPVLMGQAVF